MQRALRLLGGAGGLILAIWPAVVARADTSPTPAMTTMTVAMFQGTSAGIAAAAGTVLIVCAVAVVYRLLRRHELSML